jgi:hypothetical protein
VVTTGRCALCHRDEKPSTGFCVYHSSALENIRVSYKVWKNALDVEWRDFLREVSEMPETGLWAREVALSELEKNRS